MTAYMVHLRGTEKFGIVKGRSAARAYATAIAIFGTEVTYLTVFTGATI